MLKAYGRYKKTRDATWQVLIDNGITTLPVDVIKIANNNEISVIKNSHAQSLRPGESGVSVFDGRDWFIIYDDSGVAPEVRRFTIAHELGHILMGHPLIAGFHVHEKCGGVPRTELEANSFAMRLLAPACVLWGLGISGTDDIASLCQIPPDIAKTRSRRMKLLVRRDCFFKSELESSLYNQFEQFIELHKNNPQN